MSRPANMKRGTRRHQVSSITRAEFMEYMQEDGHSVKFRSADKGQWNEGREVVVDGVVVYRISKGERANWMAIMGDVERMVKAAEVTA